MWIAILENVESFAKTVRGVDAGGRLSADSVTPRGPGFDIRPFSPSGRHLGAAFGIAGRNPESIRRKNGLSSFRRTKSAGGRLRRRTTDHDFRATRPI